MQLFSLRPAGLFLVAGALLVPVAGGRAWAQNKMPRLASVANSGIRVDAGERVTLPYSAVSRIIVEDDQVARAFFQNGNAILPCPRRSQL